MPSDLSASPYALPSRGLSDELPGMGGGLPPPDRPTYFRNRPMPQLSPRHRILIASFLALHVLDFFLTWLLLSQSAQVYEANPLANRILASHGWLGLGMFKLACSAAALLAGLAVWRLRPASGQRLFQAMSLVLLGVVGYSVFLLTGPAQAAEHSDATQTAQNSRHLEQTRDRWHEFIAQRNHICHQLASGALTTAEATDQLDLCLARHRHSFSSYLER